MARVAARVNGGDNIKEHKHQRIRLHLFFRKTIFAALEIMHWKKAAVHTNRPDRRLLRSCGQRMMESKLRWTLMERKEP